MVEGSPPPGGLLAFDVVERVWPRRDLGEDEAMQLAVSELHAMRHEKRASRRP